MSPFPLWNPSIRIRDIETRTANDKYIVRTNNNLCDKHFLGTRVRSAQSTDMPFSRSSFFAWAISWIYSRLCIRGRHKKYRTDRTYPEQFGISLLCFSKRKQPLPKRVQRERAKRYQQPPRYLFMSIFHHSIFLFKTTTRSDIPLVRFCLQPQLPRKGSAISTSTQECIE